MPMLKNPERNVGANIPLTIDDPYKQKAPLYSVDGKGIPQLEVLVDLEGRDISAFHRMHEKELWLGISICLMFFFLVLAGL